MIKSSHLYLIAFTFLIACNSSSSNIIDFEEIKDPEKYLQSLNEDFTIVNVIKEDVNGDGYLDVHILGMPSIDYYEDYYFLSVSGETFKLVMAENYWGEEDGVEEENSYEYNTIQDYFNELEIEYGESSIVEIYYQDFNSDGFEDGIVIFNYIDDEYESFDVYMFLNNRKGKFIYKTMNELYVKHPSIQNLDFSELVIKAPYFSFEFKNEPLSQKRIITFKINEDESEFLLHKAGEINYNEDGAIINEEVQDQNDFGVVYFGEFDPNISFKKESDTVSNSFDLLKSLGNNKTIYLNEGTYILNRASNFNESAIESLKADKDYLGKFYDVYGSISEDEGFADVEIYFKNLNNIDFIGRGEVRLVVDDEILTILSFKNCSNVFMQNIYMVHEVGGICSGNVIDIMDSKNMEFENVTLDGSGDYAVYATNLENGFFQNCYFTNCSSGALDFYNSSVTFLTSSISENSVYEYLVYAGRNSILNFNICEFNTNTNNRAKGHLFYADTDSKIILDNKCNIENNIVKNIRNDKSTVFIGEDVIK